MMKIRTTLLSSPDRPWFTPADIVSKTLWLHIGKEQTWKNTQ